MSGDTTLTIVGNLTADPELRYTPTGTPVANFTVAATPRRFDKQASEWVDGEALFLRCSIWRDAAEHLAESLTRGARVIVTGRLRQRSFETREGEQRTGVELDAEEIGPSLRWTSATVTKTASRRSRDGYASPSAPGTPASSATAALAAVPGYGAPGSDQPPF